MTELISRQAAIDAIEKYFAGLPIQGHYDMVQIITNLPTIEPKRGKWIIEYDSWGGLFKTVRAHKCSICNNYLDFDGVNAGRGDANYCPNCGARMEKSE